MILRTRFLKKKDLQLSIENFGFLIEVKRRKKIIMNKKGLSPMGAVVTVAVILILAGMIVGGTFWYMSAHPTQQSVIPGGVESPTEAGKSCALSIAPVLSASGQDTGQSGTTVAITPQISVNKGAWGSVGVSPTLSAYQKLDILYNASGYHTAVIKDKEVPCSTSVPLTVPMNGNATVTISLYSTNDVVMTSGVVNETATVGGSYKFKVRMKGSDTDNTQDMQCIAEVGAGTNVSKITFDTDVGSTDKPKWYTVAGVNSAVSSFDVAPIVGSATVDHFLEIQSATQKTLSGSKYLITCYTKENFLDSNDGLLKYGTTDSLGNLKSMASYTAYGYFA